jgi:pimeloyl-ACP methyl ester carboxylesterase
MTYSELPQAVQRLYPWPGRYLVVGGEHRIHFVDEGEGEPVLMLHGNPTWSFYYRGLVRALCGTVRCVVPDHMGCGLSDKPPDWPYRLSDHIDVLDQLIVHLDLRGITLVVHDWGGPIGFGAAVRRPERFKRLIMFNTSIFSGALPLVIRMCRWPLVGGLAVRRLNAFLRVALHVGFATGVSHDVAAGYLAPYDSWNHRLAIHRFVQDIPLERGHPTGPLVEEIDRRIPCLAHLPTMIVWGEQDFVFTTEFLKGWKLRFPHAKVHTLAHAAHFVVEDANDEAVVLIRDFLAGHQLP